MATRKKVYFTVTNDLSFDQRMHRICNSLSAAGYEVVLVGRRLPESIPLSTRRFKQVRLTCWGQKGVWFYAEFNLRLFFYLLFKKMDAICSIDLDTILPCLLISLLKKTIRIYDAHELFCEMKEVVTRPLIYRCWKYIEKHSVPKFKHGYTVCSPIAGEFHKMYGLEYQVIRNMPLLEPFEYVDKKEKYILYQGAVNEGRSFETLIPVMKNVDAKLIICGDGNFRKQAVHLVKTEGLEQKVIFKGMITPAELKKYTRDAYIGITIFENTGLSNYYSLANRFFDYMHAALPQVCVDYPSYREINNKYGFALLIENVNAETISLALNNLLNNDVLYEVLKNNCLTAREELNWQQEEKKLIRFYHQLFN